MDFVEIWDNMGNESEGMWFIIWFNLVLVYKLWVCVDRFFLVVKEVW